jgi:hypothetical protein
MTAMRSQLDNPWNKKKRRDRDPAPDGCGVRRHSSLLADREGFREERNASNNHDNGDGGRSAWPPRRWHMDAWAALFDVDADVLVGEHVRRAQQENDAEQDAALARNSVSKTLRTVALTAETSLPPGSAANRLPIHEFTASTMRVSSSQRQR